IRRWSMTDCRVIAAMEMPRDVSSIGPPPDCLRSLAGPVASVDWRGDRGVRPGQPSIAAAPLPPSGAARPPVSVPALAAPLGDCSGRWQGPAGAVLMSGGRPAAVGWQHIPFGSVLYPPAFPAAAACRPGC